MRWLKALFISRKPRIRPMNFGDIADVQDMLRDSFHAAHDHLIGEAAANRILLEYDSEDAFSRYFGHDHVSILVADLQGQIVGLAIGGLSGARNFIAMLYVHTDFQGRGIGRTMLLDLIHAHPAPVVELEIVAGNRAAQRFYQSFGFDFTNETANKDGVDLWLMRLTNGAA